MSELVILNGQSMTTLEIAELTGKQHKDVMRDARRLIDQGAITQRNFALSGYKDGSGKSNPMYRLDFIGTMVLVTGYDAVRRAAVVNRWADLETGKATPAFNIPQTLPEALRAYANEVEQKELAIAQRDEAIKTKSYISDKKTATAMATASVAVRKVNRLEEQLGKATNWKATRNIPWVADFFALSKGMWIVLGKKLKSISDEMGIEVRKIESDRFGTVNAYHIDVIEKMFHRLEADENMMGKYRKENN